MDLVLRCVDPRGRKIVLTAERWADHVVERHPELGANLLAVRLAPTDPTTVRSDTKSAIRENYYRLAALPKPYDHLSLKVCVEFRPSESVGEVITAYPMARLRRGEMQRWP